MNCRTARERARAHADGEVSPREGMDLQAHLETCAGCARHARELQMMQQLLRHLPVEEPSTSFDWRLRLRLSKLEQEEVPLEPAPRISAWRWPLQFAGSAAVAAGAVLVLGILLFRSEPAPVQVAGRTPERNPIPVSNPGGVLTPVSDGAPIGPQLPRNASSYFIREDAPAATSERADSTREDSGAPVHGDTP